MKHEIAGRAVLCKPSSHLAIQPSSQLFLKQQGAETELDDKETQPQTTVEVGQKASFTKTITETDVVLFAGSTGDMNPFHIDEEFARRARFGKRIAHGMLVTGLISAVLGMKLPGPGTIYLRQELDFRHPVYIGDTVTAVAEVLHVREDKPIVTLSTNCYNQDEKLVIEGKAVVLVDRVTEERYASR